MLQTKTTALLGSTSIHAAMGLLPTFDLKIIMGRVASEHPDWSQDRLGAAELGYRRYLVMCGMEPETAIIPTLDVDEVWHAHVLHTKRYAEDCNAFFGYFLHHEPFNDENEKFPVDFTADL